MNQLGKGQGGIKRAKNDKKQSTSHISNADIRRLARRGGVKRISGNVYQDAKNSIFSFLDTIIRYATIYADYAKRKTILAQDIVFSVKKCGRGLLY